MNFAKDLLQFVTNMAIHNILPLIHIMACSRKAITSTDNAYFARAYMFHSHSITYFDHSEETLVKWSCIYIYIYLNNMDLWFW